MLDYPAMKIMMLGLALSLTGCGAIGLPIEDWLPTRATASKCAPDQDLQEVWGVWQCVKHR